MVKNLYIRIVFLFGLFGCVVPLHTRMQTVRVRGFKPQLVVLQKALWDYRYDIACLGGLGVIFYALYKYIPEDAPEQPKQNEPKQEPKPEPQPGPAQVPPVPQEAKKEEVKLKEAKQKAEGDGWSMPTPTQLPGQKKPEWTAPVLAGVPLDANGVPDIFNATTVHIPAAPINQAEPPRRSSLHDGFVANEVPLSLNPQPQVQPEAPGPVAEEHVLEFLRQKQQEKRIAALRATLQETHQELIALGAQRAAGTETIMETKLQELDKKLSAMGLGAESAEIQAALQADYNDLTDLFRQRLKEDATAASIAVRNAHNAYNQAQHKAAAYEQLQAALANVTDIHRGHVSEAELKMITDAEAVPEPTNP